MTPRAWSSSHSTIALERLVLQGDAQLTRDGPPAPPRYRAPSSTFANLHSVRIKGQLKNFNTIEEFKEASKPELLQPLLDSLETTLSSSTEVDSTALSPFLLLTFADLKKFRFYYWFAFPGVVQKPAWEVTESGWESLPKEDVEDLRRAVDKRRMAGGGQESGYLMKAGTEGGVELGSLSSYEHFFEGVPGEEVSLRDG